MTDLICMIHSGNHNRWIWHYWYSYFKKYWPWDCGIDVVFLCEHTPPTWPNITTFETGICSNNPNDIGKKRMWSDGLIDVVSKKITAKYILYTMEDFFLVSMANPAELLKICARMKTENISLTKLSNNRHTSSAVETYNGTDDLIPCDNNQWLLCSCMPTIWKKDVLLNTLLKNETGTLFERRGTRRLRAMNLDNRIYIKKPVFNFTHMIKQGVLCESKRSYIENIGKINDNI